MKDLDPKPGEHVERPTSGETDIQRPAGGMAVGGWQASGTRGLGKRWTRFFLLLVGILLPQVWMLWSSLTGQTVLLPLDSLVASVPGFYPELSVQEREGMGPGRWPNSVDAVLVGEPFRRFAVRELQAGRVPVWNPYSYAGVPFIDSGQTAVFSPYRLIEFASMDPVVLVWAQLARALVAGLGMYFFLRRGLGLTWSAGAAGAWIYPLTGFITFWNGGPLGTGATFFGWLLWATEMTIRRGGIRWPVVLGMFTCVLLLAGHPQIVGHALLLSGGYAVWRVGGGYLKRADVKAAGRGMGACALGWGVGFCLGGIQWLPQLLYILESNRYQMRAEGVVERGAQGWWGLLQAIQPWICGAFSPSTVYLLSGNRLEGGAAAYAGLLIFFVLTPLAWRARRWRGQAFFWACVAVLGMSAVVGIPLLGALVSLPPLGMLSSNRLTCLTAFALVVMGALGVNALSRDRVGLSVSGVGGRMWMLWPAVTLGVVLLLSMEMGNLRSRVEPGVMWMTRGAAPEQVEQAMLMAEVWFQGQFFVTILLLLLSAGLFICLARPGAGGRTRRILAMVVVVLGVGEMTLMAYPSIAQVDGRLYPDSPELIQRLKGLGDGRVLGVDGFEPNLNLWWDVYSPAGYDTLDPGDMTRLMRSATDEPVKHKYAVLLGFEPSGRWGVLRALNVTHLVTSVAREAFGKPVLEAERFYVYEVVGAMPRAYVPRRVRWVGEGEKVLELMNEAEFDPAETVFVTGDGKVCFDGVRGKAEARLMTPSRTEVSVEMETAGLVVLADAYAGGWEARYNGERVEILKANYGLRGVLLPAGKGVLEFVYRPRALKWGLLVTCVGAVVLAGLGVWRWRSGVD